MSFMEVMQKSWVRSPPPEAPPIYFLELHPTLRTKQHVLHACDILFDLSIGAYGMESTFATVEAAVIHYTELIRQKDAEHDEYIAQSVEVEKELEQQLSQALTDVKILKVSP